MAEPIARHTITNDGQDLTKPGNQGGDLLAPLHRDWIITAMRFQHPAQPGDEGMTATVVIELTSPGQLPPGHPSSKPRLGPWSHGVPPMPV